MTLKTVKCQIEYEGRGVGRFVDGTISTSDLHAIRGYYGLARLKASSFRRFQPGQVVDVEIQLADTGKCYLIGAAAADQKPKKQEPKLEVLDIKPDFRPAILSILKQRIEQLSDPMFGFFIDDETSEIFSAAHALLAQKPNRPVKLLIRGLSGYGKTTLPGLFAASTGRYLFRMNCASIRDPEEWFGHREAVDGSTIFVSSKFIDIVTKGNAVIILDEYNRLEPYLHNTLYPLLDDDAKTTIYDREFKVGPNVLFVGTINEGYEYTGTFELDAANFNRFDLFLQVGPMPRENEIDILVRRTNISRQQSSLIVDVARQLRDKDRSVCTTRTTLQIANLVAIGIDVRSAFQNVVVLRSKDTVDVATSQRKAVLDIINAKLGIYKPTRGIFGAKR